MISICIPTWEARGHGVNLLRRCLESLENQTFRKFEIVVSDNSKNEEIRLACEKFGRVRYIYNPVIGLSANTNNAMRCAKGELVKILYQDDYLASLDSLQEINDNFQGQWLVTASNNNVPSWNDRILQGNNTLGSPSVLTLRKDGLLFFREDLKWLLDCEFYDRMYKKYGAPTILNKVGVVIGQGEWQETNNLTEKEKNEEYTRVAADRR